MRDTPPADFDALLFDLGGVLIDIDFGRAFAAWGAAAGVPASDIAARFSFDAAYAAHERGEIGAAQYFAALRRALAIELSDDQVLAGWQSIIGDEIAGMRQLLAAAARRWPLHLFSNTSDAHRRHWAARHGTLLQPFRTVFLSCDIGLRKPDPAAFAFVARQVDAPPHRIAFFDDTEDNVTGARRAGLRAFQARSAADVAAALGFSA